MNIDKKVTMSEVVERLHLVAWSVFFSVVKTLDKELDSRKDRFDKSDIIEKTLEKASDGTFIWTDELGCDHRYYKDWWPSEMKSQKNCLHTRVLGMEKAKTATIKVINTLGSSIGRALQRTFEGLILVDTGSDKSYSVAVASFDVVEKYAKSVGDGFTVQIPCDELHWVVKPSDINALQGDFSYGKAKQEAQDKFINQFTQGK